MTRCPGRQCPRKRRARRPVRGYVRWPQAVVLHGACPWERGYSSRDAARLKGTVVSYHPEYSLGLLGLFSVRLDNAIWQICDTSDVIVLAPSKETPSVAIARTEAAGR
jgi:hypothetical protein